MGIGDEAPQVASPAPLTEAHDTNAFVSGEAVLDDWLRRRAWTNQRGGASRTYVLAARMHVVGYYSLAAGAIAVDQAPGRVRRNMPDPIPMALLGRLAVTQAWQGKGFGGSLLRDAIMRVMQAAEIIGVRGILVHALTPAAKQFYEAHGFRESPSDPMLLVVALQDVAGTLDGDAGAPRPPHPI